jgi:PAS domain S-box-containing protein
MSMLRNSLSKKLTLMNMLVSAAAVLLVSVSFFVYDAIVFRKNVINNLSTQAQIIGANSVSPLIFSDARAAENTLSALRASRRIVYAGIYTPNRAYFAGYWRDQANKPSMALPNYPLDEDLHYWFETGQFALVRTIFFEGKPVGIVYIRTDLSAIYERFQSYGIILLVIVSVSLIAALALSRLLQRVISQPILRLAETARNVSRDKDFAVRVPETGDHDEVATLVEAFNGMLFEIQKRDSALQESERQFRTLADSIPQMAWMADAEGKRLWYNQRWYEYTGASPEQVLGWGWRSFHDPQKLPEVLERWKISLTSDKPFEMIYPLRGADGTYRQFLTLAVPVRDAKGKVVRWFGSNTDITEQLQSQETLRRTEKLAATGRLAASIAHEINNPLEAVTNLVYLARKQPANATKYLELADLELDRIAQITKNTLGFYRDSASTRELDIAEVLDEVLALYERKLKSKEIAVRREYERGITVAAYPGEVRQIFANLVSNAIEALPEKGHLTIRAGSARTQDGSGRQGVRILFVDNGTGITPANRKKIFEPFYTTKKDVGTGLGLWLSLQLVEKHHGALRLRSSVRPGRTWTAFSLFLPEQPLENNS